ncbi:MAG: hypothetical protein PHC95_10350 [Parabacteroides sp.]|nr:hypothetical protein [Parabacteroides sp.]
MKAFKLVGVAAAAALVLLTSCLGEGNNSFSNQGFGVGTVNEKSYKTVLSTPFGALYSPTVSILPDVCYYAAFEVDLSSAENANAATNGYSVATISGLQEIEKGTANFYVTPDTTTLLDKELVIKDMVTGSYIEKYIFLGTSFDARKNQVNRYQLYWNQTDSVTTENGISTYSLFLRGQKSNVGTGETSTSTSEFRAFKIGDVLEPIMKKEGKKGAEKFNLKINYLSSINEKDSTDLTWSSLKVECGTIKE